MRDDKKIFLLGERRRVSLYLWLESDMTWVPENPAWDLMAPDGTKKSTGVAEALQTAEGWTLSTLCEPDAKGDWILLFSFDLGDEHVRRAVRIKVV